MNIPNEILEDLLKNIDTNLLCCDIEILDYQRTKDNEIIVIDLPFTTTGNILTYLLDYQENKITLIEAHIYATKNPQAKLQPYIDNDTIVKLFNFARNNYDSYHQPTSKILKKHQKKLN